VRQKTTKIGYFLGLNLDLKFLIDPNGFTKSKRFDRIIEYIIFYSWITQYLRTRYKEMSSTYVQWTSTHTHTHTYIYIYIYIYIL
jgi:hypothetical protein